MAPATAATATSAASTRERGRRAGTVGTDGAKNRKLDRGFLAFALRARDFLLLIDDDFLKAGFAIVANVFVDGHRDGPCLPCGRAICRFPNHSILAKSSAGQDVLPWLWHMKPVAKGNRPPGFEGL